MLRAHRVSIFQTSTRAAWVCTVWPHMVTKGMLGYGCSLLTKGVSHRWQTTSHPNMVTFDLKACWQQLADQVWDLKSPPKKHNPKTKPVGDDIVSNTHHLFTVYNLDTFCSIITLLFFLHRSYLNSSKLYLPTKELAIITAQQSGRLFVFTSSHIAMSMRLSRGRYVILSVQMAGLFGRKKIATTWTCSGCSLLIYLCTYLFWSDWVLVYERETDANFFKCIFLVLHKVSDIYFCYILKRGWHVYNPKLGNSQQRKLDG